MCNSSSQVNDSMSVFEESIMWVCICRGHVGSIVNFATLAIFFIVGTPIHCWSIWVFVQDSIKPSLVFPLNITIGELFLCMHCCIDLTITSYPTPTGDRLVAFSIALCWTVRPLIQICMCLEHYLAVIHPVTFLRYKGIEYRTALAAASWLFSVGNSLRLVFIGVEYFPDHVFFLIFCIAVTIISFCCASVLYALKRPGPGDRNNVKVTEKNKIENQQKRKAFRIISHILISILVCYLPQVVAYFMRMAQISKHIYICNAFPLILSFSLIAVLISPLIRMYNEGQLVWIFKIIEQMKRNQEI